MDDCLFATLAKCAFELIRKLAALAALAVAVFHSHSLSLNFKPNKSEALIRLRGPNARTVYNNITVLDGSHMQLEVQGSKFPLRIVSHYVHMGGSLNPRNDLMPEIHRRVATSSSVAKPLSSRVLSLPQLKSGVRMMLASSLVFSRLLFNACTWSQLSAKCFRTLNNLYMRVIRTVAGKRNYKDSPIRWSDMQVLVDTSAPHLSVLLRWHRLRYLVRVFKYAPIALKHILSVLASSPTSWTGHVVKDLQSIWQSLESLYITMPDPATNVEKWFTAIGGDPQHWLGVFRKAFHFQTAHMQVGPQDVSVPVVPSSVLGIEVQSEFVCVVCDKIFPSKVQLASHNVKLHDYVNPLRLHIFTTQCLHCRFDYHSKFRLFNHLEHVRNCGKCAAFYMSEISSMSTQEYRSVAASFNPKAPDNLLQPPPVLIAFVD